MLTREETASASLLYTIDYVLATLDCRCFDQDAAMHYAAMSLGMTVIELKKTVEARKRQSRPT